MSPSAPPESVRRASPTERLSAGLWEDFLKNIADWGESAEVPDPLVGADLAVPQDDELDGFPQQPTFDDLPLSLGDGAVPADLQARAERFNRDQGLASPPVLDPPALGSGELPREDTVLVPAEEVLLRASSPPATSSAGDFAARRGRAEREEFKGFLGIYND